MTADFFTQMRVAHEHAAHGREPDDPRTGNFSPPFPNQWPTPAPGTPPLLTTRDVLRYATINGAKALRLDGKIGSLTPGKEADIIILDATGINVAPLNHVPGAVVSLMDRTNVETVIVAGKVRKWKGQLLDVDLPSCASSSRPRATTSSPRRASRRTCSAASSLGSVGRLWGGFGRPACLRVRRQPASLKNPTLMLPVRKPTSQ